MLEKIVLGKLDEVHHRISCSPSVAQELADVFTFDVPNASFMKRKNSNLKWWDGKIRLFNPLTGRLYCGLQRKVERFAQLNDYSVELNGIDSDFPFSVKECEWFIDKLDLPFLPRPYQAKAFIMGVRKRRGLIVSPTASGKSLIMYMLYRYFNAKTLVIVPTINLVNQLAKDFADYGYKGKVHKIFSGQERDDPKAQVYISTWQTASTLSKKWVNQFGMFLGDEAHTFQAKSLKKMMEKAVNIPIKLGLTGSFDDASEGDKLTVEALFGPIIFREHTHKLQEQGYLSPVEINVLELKYTKEERSLVIKMNYQDEIKWLCAHPRRNNFIKNLALSLKGNTLLLFDRVDKHGKILYNMISKESPDVYYVSGETKGDVREEIRQIVRGKKKSIIVASLGTFSTGIDIPNLNDIIMAHPSKALRRLIQSIGRGLRKALGKSHCTVHDIVDDLTWKKEVNYAAKHYVERLKLYIREKFPYKTYRIDI